MSESIWALTRRGVLHRYPANEACNLDDRRGDLTRLRAADLDRSKDKIKRRCRRCFPRFA